MFDPAGPVLGIDPGVSRAATAPSSASDGRLRAAVCGVIRTAPADPLPERLLALDGELAALVRQLRPSALAVERGPVPEQRVRIRDLGWAGERARTRRRRPGRYPGGAVQPERGEARGDRRRPRGQGRGADDGGAPARSSREVPKPADAADASRLVCASLARAPRRGSRSVVMLGGRVGT